MTCRGRDCVHPVILVGFQPVTISHGGRDGTRTEPTCRCYSLCFQLPGIGYDGRKQWLWAWGARPEVIYT